MEVWHLISALMSQENEIVPAIMEEMGIGSSIQLAFAGTEKLAQDCR